MKEIQKDNTYRIITRNQRIQRLLSYSAHRFKIQNGWHV